MPGIILQFESCQLEAELFNTPTGNKIFNSLPFESAVNTWGDEIYFSIALSLPLEPEARAAAKIGELGYWPTAKAFCIFFGPTPASINEEPRAISPVNIFGNLLIKNDLNDLKKVQDREKVKVIRL